MTHLCGVVSIVDCPPSAQELTIHTRLLRSGRMCLLPWLVFADEMHEAEAVLEVPVSRLVLVAGARGAIIRETQAVPWAMVVVFVQETLVGAVKACATSCHGLHGIVLSNARRQKHDPAIEAVRPSYIGGSGEVMMQLEQLIGRAKSNDIGIDVDNLAEVLLSPECNLCESKAKIQSIEANEVFDIRATDAIHWDDVVI